MVPSYTKIETPRGPAFVKAGARDEISRADSIVFDCDGVLIDTRKSYDAAIVATVGELVRGMFGVRLPWKDVASSLIQSLRNTGGFNNDWDTVYAITLLAACSLPPRHSRKFAGLQSTSRPSAVRLPRRDVSRVFARVAGAVRNLGKAANSTGQEAVDEYVLGSLPLEQRELCAKVREYLGYPGKPPSSMLASLFDEIYHGRRLYKQMYGAGPSYYRGRGFIEDDKVVVLSSDLSSLSRAFQGRLGLATGRPRQAAAYSLGKLISFFRPEASIFIGDADVRPGSGMDKFRKPSGESLLLVQEKLRSKRLVYVGDSVEDWQMVVNAKKSSDGISFAGIYGLSYEPARQLRFFKREGAELIVPTVRQMAGVIREVAGR